MIKESKRFAALGLATAMVATAFTGCTSGNNTTETTTAAGNTSAETTTAGNAVDPSAEPITITMFSQVANFSGIQPGWSGSVFLDKFNVKINMEPDTNGALATKMQDGNLGDIVVWGSRSEDYFTAIKNGYLLNWNTDNLLDNYGPYIKENLATALEYNASVNDGVVYGFTGTVSLEGSPNADGLFYTWDTRWDLYNELGQPEINDLDDLMNLMLEMKKIYPTDENGNETYALSMWPDWDGNMVMYVKAFATAYYGYDEWGFGLYDVDTGVLHGALEENGPYYTSLKFINKLYQNGLIDPDSSSQDYQKMTTKMKAGGCFFSIFNYAGSSVYNTAEHVAENRMMLPLIPNDATPLIYGSSTTGSGYEWTICSKTQYPELCMQIINWLATPEGALTYWYGPQGVCWDYDADGKLYLTDFGKKCKNDRTTDMSEVGYAGTYNDGSLQVNANIWGTASYIPNDPNGQVFYSDMWESSLTDAQCDIEALWREFTGETLAMYYLNNKEGAKLSLPTGVSHTDPSKKNDLYVDWKNVAETIKTGSWKCIYAASDEEFDQLFASMLKDAQAYNYDACIEYSAAQAEVRHQMEELLKSF
ncbi:MAG: extracellular solute-binding protein [Lachnospiraceae bacterium]|nr:extracellular solute-binding protein [Lachnospiraceae bacterium]